MNTSYELWNVESGNIIGSFATVSEALAVVRHLLDSYGQTYARELSLGRRDGDGPVTILGEGDQLVTLLEARLGSESDERVATGSHSS